MEVRGAHIRRWLLLYVTVCRLNIWFYASAVHDTWYSSVSRFEIDEHFRIEEMEMKEFDHDHWEYI